MYRILQGEGRVRRNEGRPKNWKPGAKGNNLVFP